ncbi:MAG: plasmid stabilization protein ParE [Rhodobacteraceae bacterium PARR1]|nr:MAG: plasmid stabilization protein ParE [Rhodobacteraceae bacterium PARR1]
MARPWVLTRQAELALADIAIWTEETFGTGQASAYAEDLIATCTALAEGTRPSRNCRGLVAADVPEDLRYARIGQHFVVFVLGPERMVVIDFLHQRMDIPARLAALGDWDR